MMLTIVGINANVWRVANGALSRQHKLLSCSKVPHTYTSVVDATALSPLRNSRYTCSANQGGEGGKTSGELHFDKGD